MENSDSLENLSAKFISNTPIGDDLFEGKSQERVANNISKILINDKDIRVIGIDGGWGSGKSNLIEIVKRKLKAESDSKYNFFIYDAWGHQEDLQRRSLLEEMTFHLTKLNEHNVSIIGDDEKWKKKLKELLAKSKETEKKTIPSLSLGIVFSGLALILTPLFKSLSDLFECGWLKILITSIPLILLLALYLYYYVTKTDKKNKTGHRAQEAANKLFYIYQQSQKEEITFERISEEEPSVKKFRDWMKEISEDLKEKMLLIVFDNMDRLPNKKILELWSSIHTFFAESNYDNIKVLIPFDRQNIKSAFEDSKSSENNYADDFINKTFNIVYRVSPPILSDWKKFFIIKWNEAFKVKDEELNKVVQVFDHLAPSKTPREIVVFINEFVTISQICNNIPHRYIALFIISKSVILAKPDIEIIKPSYTKSLNFLYDDDEDLPKFIAALVYQIDPERALEIIFTERLTYALNNNNKSQILNISESKFFDDILAKAITQVENFENSILCLKEIEDKISQKTWDDLYQKLDPRLSSSADAIIQPYQLIVIGQITNKRRYISDTFKRFRSAEKFVALDYYNSVKKAESVLKENNANFKINACLQDKQTTAEDFIALLKGSGDSETFGINCDNVGLNDSLEKIVDLNELINSTYLSKLDKKYSLDKFITSLETKIDENQSDRAILAAYYKAYKNASPNTLKTLLADNFIYTHFVDSADLKDEFYYDLLSMRISKWDTFNTSYASYFEEVLEKVDDAVAIEGLAGSIQYFITYGDLLLKLSQFNKPLLKEVISALTTKSRVIRKLHLVSIIKQIDVILDATEIAPSTLLNKLNDWDNKAITEKDITDLLKNVNFYVLCATVINPLTIHCVNLANKYFENVTDDQWLIEFQNPKSNIVNVSLSTLKNQYSAKAVSAIKETLLKIAKSEIPIPVKNTWDKIIEKSNRSSIKSAIKDIKDLYNNNKEINSSEFLFFGQWLFTYGELEDNKSSLRRIFRKNVLENENCVNLILTYKDQFLAIYSNADEREDFNNEIKVLMEESKTFIQPLAALLDIKQENRD